MPPFVVRQETPLPTETAWSRITDWSRHARHIPLTRIKVRTPPPTGVGTVFTARTGLGRAGFDDPMEVVEWKPPRDRGAGRCRLEKRGRVMLGSAELTVEPQGGGSVAVWREEARLARTPAFTHRASAVAGRLLFARVLRGLLTG